MTGICDGLQVPVSFCYEWSVFGMESKVIKGKIASKSDQKCSHFAWKPVA